MTKQLHIAGQVYRVGEHEGERRALEIVEALRRDAMLLRAVEVHLQKEHDAARKLLPVTEGRNFYSGVNNVAVVMSVLHVLEKRLLPLVDELRLPDAEWAPNGWLNRLMGNQLIGVDAVRDLDAEACRMLHEVWLDLAEWRANRQGRNVRVETPRNERGGWRQRVGRWWQEMGDRLP